MLPPACCSIGPAPAIGPTLDPLTGIWSVARRAELPRVASGRIPRLGARVDVRYDSRDVPHIFAASEADAYRALGYVVARDRLFQIELQTRAGAGTLTELVGKLALGADHETREMGMPRAAARALAAMDTTSADMQAMRAYADGVNAWIDQMDAADLPIEYRLLGRTPRRWSPIDALHLLNRMSETLSLDDVERRRKAAAEVVGDTAARALFPVHSPLQQPIVPSSYPGLRMRKGALPAPTAPDTGVELDTTRSIGNGREGAAGSNNWAVSPRRTKAGYALLAGDPHLDMTLPSLWYEVHSRRSGAARCGGCHDPRRARRDSWIHA